MQAAIKKPDTFRHRALGRTASRLGLGGRGKRPSGLRVQGGLSRRGSGSRRCLGSGCFRCFLRSRLLGCFLGGWLFGRRFLRSCFLGWGLFRCYFLGRRFLGSSFFSRSFFGRSLFSGCFFSWSLFSWSLLSCYFFSRCCLFCGCSFLCGSGLFCGRFFCSCHFNFLLDQLTKSTSCELECMKRFMVLGVCPAP